MGGQKYSAVWLVLRVDGSEAPLDILLGFVTSRVQPFSFIRIITFGKSGCAERAEKRRFTSEDRARGGSHARRSKFARDTIWIVVGALTFHFLQGCSRSPFL